MKELLIFLYNFYEQGDYAHKSLNDFFDTSTTQWNNLNSIHDLKDRINKMIKADQIELDNSEESFRGWGEIENGQTFNYRDIFSINARIKEKGVNIIEHALEKDRQKKIDKSVLDTNHSVIKVNKLFWITALIAAASAAASIRSCQLTNQQNKLQTELSSKDSTIEELKNKLSQKENVPISHPSSTDSSKKKIDTAR